MNDQYDSLSSLFKSLDLLCLCNCASFGWNTVNFFTAAGMELWFGFMLETVLVAQGCFSCPWAVLTQCQGPFLTHRWGGWGDHKELEGPQPGQLPTNDSGVSHSIWWHAQQIRLKEEGGRRECSEWWCLPSQGTSVCVWVLQSWGGWTPACLWEVVNKSLVFLFLHAWFSLFLSVSAQEFTHFGSPDSPPFSLPSRWVTERLLSC